MPMNGAFTPARFERTHFPTHPQCGPFSTHAKAATRAKFKPKTLQFRRVSAACSKVAGVWRAGGRRQPRGGHQRVDIQGLFAPVRFQPHMGRTCDRKRAAGCRSGYSSAISLTAKKAQDCTPACTGTLRHVLQVEAVCPRLRPACARRPALPPRARTGRPHRSPPQDGGASAPPPPSPTWSRRPIPRRWKRASRCCARAASAADAAIAVQLVLNLVEPQSSGIGGGAFALHWNAANEQLKSYDGRETRAGRGHAGPVSRRGPAARIRRRDIRRPERRRARHAAPARDPAQAARPPPVGADCSRRPSSSPSTAFASRRACICCCAGTAPRASPRAARRYFFDTTGSARPAGYLLRNPEFAATLRAIAERGPDAFYTGAIAEAIVARCRQAPNHQGDITRADLAGYSVKEREPVCVGYRRIRVCSMGPPSSGGMAVAQILKLLEPFDLGQGPRRP